MCKIVTMYNNKGGVSKTTTLFNLGVYLSQQGRRVVFADCDPQCNLTELFLASYPEIDEPGTELPGPLYMRLFYRDFAARLEPLIRPPSILLNRHCTGSSSCFVETSSFPWRTHTWARPGIKR